MNHIVFVFNAISRNQREWDEYVWSAYIVMFFVNITKMVCRNMITSYIVVKMLFNFYYYKN